MRVLRAGLILLIILGVLAVVADRLAVRWAEGEVASRTQTAMELEREPEVSIEGFPFLTQVAGRELERVRLSLDAHRIQLDDQEITARDLSLDLRNVVLEDGYRSAVARDAEGSAVLGYGDLSELATQDVLGLSDQLALELSYAGDGAEDHQVAVQLLILGQEVVPPVLAEMSFEGDLLALRLDEVPSLPLPGLEDRLRDIVHRERTLHGLPSGVTLEGLVATERGVELTFTGTDLPLGGNGLG
ncbi:LmeA family phospholipid-binding protein [Streptomyces alkaliphilus]|uniref:LmeA family phospholipid-binding protein n=1 Tax=Streptomyces alkaliphilus TaxID=1472722 RepID=UPI001180071C|nr:DUF2993 domain-containing protein [Streptomyces alkaliphilus]MQS07403.1 DUF2993 domain-containing protein [Streptomyces alkaliphilus]